MRSKKVISSVLLLSLCSGLLLTSCNNGKQGEKIRKKLEDTYGGNFYLTETIPQYDEIWPDINFPYPVYYTYIYEWDEAEGKFLDTVYVTTKQNEYRTNANLVKYYDELDEYFIDELSDNIDGEVIATYFFTNGTGTAETAIEELDLDDILEDWELKLDCIIAVEDVEDHESIEKAIDRIFGDYKIRVNAEIVSIDDVDDILSRVDNTADDRLELYFNYDNVLPTHEYYIYISDTDVIKGATGWHESKAREN